MNNFFTIRNRKIDKFYLLPVSDNKLYKDFFDFFGLIFDHNYYCLGKRSFAEIAGFYNLDNPRMLWPGTICSDCWSHFPWTEQFSIQINHCWKCQL